MAQAMAGDAVSGAVDLAVGAASAAGASGAAAEAPPSRFVQFSKVIIAAMVGLWFAGALFGGGVVVSQLRSGSYYVSVDSLLSYISAPVTGSIVGYMVKSALENREKIIKYPEIL